LLGFRPSVLALSISIEATELLEIFQWKVQDEVDSEMKRKIQEELVDVMIYCLSLANAMGFDVATIVCEKIKKEC